MIDTPTAEKIARGLREFGYPHVTADDVLAQLAKPRDEQSVIGRMATGILEDAGYPGYVEDDD